METDEMIEGFCQRVGGGRSMALTSPCESSGGMVDGSFICLALNLVGTSLTTLEPTGAAAAAPLN